ncbi:MAG: chlorophyll synthesis pathway protein BchC [Pseudomonadota bacterium]
MDSTAVIFEEGKQLSLNALTLKEPKSSDVVVDTLWSGVSAGTERLLWTGEMPWFPGLSYPLVPGYEAVGEIVEAGPESARRVGDRVFVPGATCYRDASGLFGASASCLVVPGHRTVPVDIALNEQAILLSLAATAHHILAGSPEVSPMLIVGHGALGRLIARIAIAMGRHPPTVWESQTERSIGVAGYQIKTCETDAERSYAIVIDASGDPDILDLLISRLQYGGEVVLAGFYSQPLSFVFPPAFMREARFRVAAEWKPADLEAVKQLIEANRLDLDGLISHRSHFEQAEEAYRIAFSEPACTKMVLDWRRGV